MKLQLCFCLIVLACGVFAEQFSPLVLQERAYEHQDSNGFAVPQALPQAPSFLDRAEQQRMQIHQSMRDPHLVAPIRSARGQLYRSNPADVDDAAAYALPEQHAVPSTASPSFLLQREQIARPKKAFPQAPPPMRLPAQRATQFISRQEQAMPRRVAFTPQAAFRNYRTYRQQPQQQQQQQQPRFIRQAAPVRAPVQPQFVETQESLGMSSSLFRAQQELSAMNRQYYSTEQLNQEDEAPLPSPPRMPRLPPPPVGIF